MNSKKINRRDFLQVSVAATAATAASLSGCKQPDKLQGAKPLGTMTYRTNPKTGDKVSLLGYGCMRWPTVEGESARESGSNIDQDAVNRLVDEAIANGVNYFDTSPAYCRGFSEQATGIALSRHSRDKYFVATKLSNFAPQQQTFEASKEMFLNSMRYLQVDYIDYLLLHALGSIDQFNQRFINNGVLDYLQEERKAGRIRNLGFSFHGSTQEFDYLIDNNDRFNWDFVMIQLNYYDWHHSRADYLYQKLHSAGIPVIIMEPLLGGRLSKLPVGVVRRLKERRPEDSAASWAFRFAGTHESVLTVLSGMTYMEHLQDNLLTYSPLDPITAEEEVFLKRIADEIATYKTIQCNDCKYCMPCPYAIDIPGSLLFYNKCVVESKMALGTDDPLFEEARRYFLVGYDRAVERPRQADHCIGCKQCNSHCPQKIDIPKELEMINNYAEMLRRAK